jgi:hypothetical protein
VLGAQTQRDGAPGTESDYGLPSSIQATYVTSQPPDRVYAPRVAEDQRAQSNDFSVPAGNMRPEGADPITAVITYCAQVQAWKLGACVTTFVYLLLEG